MRDIQIKATKQYFPLVFFIMLYMVVHPSETDRSFEN